MILFTAIWCPHCQKVKKFLDSNPQYTVEICDVDVDFDTPTAHGVKQLPALLRNDDTLMVESLDIIEYIKDNA
ncbi:hypothetical protein VPHD148_0324 [Vibrio phage D148]